MKDYTLRVTDNETGECCRNQDCDVLLVICVNREGDREIELGREECLSTGISSLGEIEAPPVLALIDATASSIDAIVGSAAKRVAPIEWGMRRDALERIRDKLKKSVEKVEILCGMAGLVKGKEDE